MENFSLREYFRSRSAGFYIGCAAAALSLVVAFVYLSGYGDGKYMSWAVFFLPLLAFAAFVGLSVSKATSPFAAAVMTFFDLLTLCLFIRTVYMYLSEVFYGGVNIESMANLSFEFVFCLVSMLLNLVLGIIALFIPPIRKERFAQAKEATK